MHVTGRYSVVDVCRHIIHYSNDDAIYIDNLKLQKLLYFSQANYLFVSEGKIPCFNEHIVAWQYGPVVLEAYQEFKVYGSAMIPRITTVTEFDRETMKIIRRPVVDPIAYVEQDASLLQGTGDYFRDFSGVQLVNVTHRQKPWLDAYQSGINSVIENQAINDYFKAG